MCRDCKGWYGPHKKDFRRGGVDPEDFYAETPHRKKSKKKHVRTKCPETNGSHVYVRDTYTGSYRFDEFYAYFGFYRDTALICCGCGHVKKNSVRRSEAYVEKFGTGSIWASREWNDEGYMRFLHGGIYAGARWREIRQQFITNYN